MCGKVIIKNKKGVYALPLEDIAFMEKRMRKILVHTDYIDFEFYGKFEDLDPFLDDRFMRCHRSFVINMDRIILMTERGIFICNSEPIFFGRDTYARARKVFNDYLSEKSGQAQ